ncbi:MAG TPA: cyclic nucleotide-binding domain-containing protein [Gammaproteobacteria bacterium]|nr:cyclic nucleotide-binding domain-containing protein [Gammaproteobacteria bacterium]
MKQIRRRVYSLLESGSSNDATSRLLNAFLVSLIVLNVIAVTLETEPALESRYHSTFIAFEIFSVVIFSIEYLCRLWVCTDYPRLQNTPAWRARLHYAVTPFAVIDLLAILPFFLWFLIPFDLRMLRIFRLLRLLKLARYSPALATIVKVLRAESRALFGALIIMFGLLLLSSSLIYYAEHKAQPQAFGSIPQAMWWAIATLSTVGYGDIVPVTLVGRIIGGVVMILGLGMFSIPVGIIATAFGQAIHEREFVITWGMIANVPLFKGLDSATIIEIANLLQARKYRRNTVIARRGEIAEGIYILSSGKVRLDLPGLYTPVILKEGDFFGELALLHESKRTANIVAMEETRALLLEAGDFHRLLEARPEVKLRIHAVAKKRAAEFSEAREVLRQQQSRNIPNEKNGQ